MHSTFESLLDVIHELNFSDVALPGLPPLDTVRALRDAIEVALREPGLMIDCITRDIDEISTRGRVRAGLVPFYTDDRTGIRFATGMWAPRVGVPAHEHAGWTISALMHNELEVRTYDRIAACGGRLVQKNIHPAHAGMAGYIYEPGVHAPWNPTPSWAISLHLLGPHDGDAPADGRRFQPPEAPRPAAPGPFDRYFAHWQKQRVLRAQATALAAHRDDRVAPALERIVALGNTRTRELALSILASVAPERAAAQRPFHHRSCLRGKTRLQVIAGSPIEREVQIHDGRASLVAWVHGKPVTLLRTNAESRNALERLASDEPLCVEQLPGLGPEDQIRLVEALDEWGVLEATAELGQSAQGAVS